MTNVKRVQSNGNERFAAYQSLKKESSTVIIFTYLIPVRPKIDADVKLAMALFKTS